MSPPNTTAVLAIRQAANRLGLRVARQTLDAAHRLDVTIEDTRIAIVPERQPALPWPPIELLSEAEDGPWPPPVRVHCTWESGSVDLALQISYWRTTGAYRHFVALTVVIPSARRELVWITIPRALLDVDSTEPVVRASTAPPRKRENAEESSLAAARTRFVVKRAGLPFPPPARRDRPQRQDDSRRGPPRYTEDTTVLFLGSKDGTAMTQRKRQQSQSAAAISVNLTHKHEEPTSSLSPLQL